MNSSYHEGKFLGLKVLKAKSLPDQNQPEKCKPDLSPVSCTIEKVGNEQHILHLCLGHIHRLQIHFTKMHTYN